MADILDQVHLTPRAVATYHQFAQRLAYVMKEMGIHPSEIPDEEAYENDEGGLVVYVDLSRDKGRIEFTIPPSDWA